MLCRLTVGEISSALAFTCCSGQSVGSGKVPNNPAQGPPTARIETPNSHFWVFDSTLPARPGAGGAGALPNWAEVTAGNETIAIATIKRSMLPSRLSEQGRCHRAAPLGSIDCGAPVPAL